MLLAYARVSTLDQADESKASITEQLARCKAIAAARGATSQYDYATYVDRGVSGSIPLSKRPHGKALLARADRGDLIVASKLDRIFRSASDALATVERLKVKGIGLIICDMGIDPVGDSPATSMFFAMLAAFAQFERERIKERILEGKAAKRKQGGHIGGPIPFGYRKDGKGKNARLVRCEKEQAHIAAAKQIISAGPVTLSQVARVMASGGMLGRDGKPYRFAAIERMIRPHRKYGVDLVDG